MYPLPFKKIVVPHHQKVTTPQHAQVDCQQSTRIITRASMSLQTVCAVSAFVDADTRAVAIELRAKAVCEVRWPPS